MDSLIIILLLLGIIIFALIFFSLLLFLLVNKKIEKMKLKKASYLAQISKVVSPNQIIFLGDSLTDFYPVDILLSKYNIYNLGISSDTTDNVINRLNTNLYPVNPKCVFIQIGTNDFIHKKSNHYIYSNIIKIIESIKENTNALIYLISLYPVNKKKSIFSFAFVRSRNNNNIKKINIDLLNYCNNHNITFINMYNHLIDTNDNLKKEYTVEGLHINFEGYKVITNILIPYLEEVNKNGKDA